MARITSCVALLVAASWGSVFAQEETRKHYWCPMHPQVVGEAAVSCPICGMDLVLGRARPGIVEIEPGGLREFCVQFVNDAMARFSGSGPGGSSFVTPELYLQVHGDEGLPVVRGLLQHDDLDRVHSAAWHLGRVEDRESVDALLAELSSDRLAYRAGFHCPEHSDVRSASPGRCTECGSKLVLRTDLKVAIARLAVAAALHRLGRDEGFDALRELVEGPHGGYALGCLAFRDTAGVRTLLEQHARADDPWLAACAVAGELSLGIHDRLSEALEALRTDHSPPHPILSTLAETPCPEASDTLKAIAERENETWERRSLAALASYRLGEDSYADFLADACHQLWSAEDLAFSLNALSRCANERHMALFERVIEELPTHRELGVAGAVRLLFPPDKR